MTYVGVRGTQLGRHCRLVHMAEFSSNAGNATEAERTSCRWPAGRWPAWPCRSAGIKQLCTLSGAARCSGMLCASIVLLVQQRVVRRCLKVLDPAQGFEVLLQLCGVLPLAAMHRLELRGSLASVEALL